jgi:hypothetical protein
VRHKNLELEVGVSDAKTKGDGEVRYNRILMLRMRIDEELI